MQVIYGASCSPTCYSTRPQHILQSTYKQLKFQSLLVNLIFNLTHFPFSFLSLKFTLYIFRHGELQIEWNEFSLFVFICIHYFFLLNIVVLCSSLFYSQFTLWEVTNCEGWHLNIKIYPPLRHFQLPSFPTISQHVTKIISGSFFKSHLFMLQNRGEKKKTHTEQVHLKEPHKQKVAPKLKGFQE